PSTSPMTSETPTTRNASSSDGRAPCTSWASTSQPCRLVPKGCSPPNHCGGTRDSEMSQRCGSVLLNSPGNAATTTKNRLITQAMITSGRRRIRRNVSDHSDRVAGAGGSDWAAIPAAVDGSVITDPRVQHRVQQVHHEHHHDGDHGQD